MLVPNHRMEQGQWVKSVPGTSPGRLRWRSRILPAAATAVVGVLSGAALGQQSTSEEYLARSEQGQVMSSDAENAPDVRPGSVADEPQDAEDRKFELFPESELKPGWERVRAADWMSLGRLGQFGVQIARAGSMDLYMGLDTVGRVFAWDQSNVEDGGIAPGSLEPGFDTAFGNVSFLADFSFMAGWFFSMQ